MKKDKIIYWIATGLLSFMIVSTVIMKYFMTYSDIVAGFENHFGFPGWLVLPLAIAKLLGIVAILTKLSAFLKNLAYAGFFYNFLMAIGAHIAVGDGQFVAALVALVLVIVSFIYDKKVFAQA